jgi:RHS repeat-associated protein
VDLLGYATVPANVTVNGQAAYEKGEYFWKETTVANGSAPQSVQIEVVATQQGNSASDSGRLLVPKATQSFSYDFDGNLTFDGIWHYEWDGENRLKAVTMTNLVGVPNPQRFRLELGYDWLGRRLAKTVKTWTGTEFANPVTTRFVYDGWRLLAQLDADNSVVRSYTWGLDLSGTLDDAGGIGGLLFVTQHPALTTHFACYDGNGNVVALVAADGTGVTARYEYGPFGEPIGVRGPYAETNPIRWTTKYMDVETELVYYGSRYYSPSLGRWISRDPIEEDGGANLYAFVGNCPLTNYDPVGRDRGKKRIAVTGYENKSAEELEAEAKRVRAEAKATGDRSKLKHAEALDAAAKLKKQPKRLAGKYWHSRGKTRGGFASPTTMVLISGAALALDLALAKVNTTSAIIQVREAIQYGVEFEGTLGHLADFVRHADVGDTALADLDAAIFAAEASGANPTRALVIWETLQEENP